MLVAKTPAQTQHDKNEGGRARAAHDFLGGSSNGFLFSLIMKNCKFHSLAEQIES